MNVVLDAATCFGILTLLQENPQLSQRQPAVRIGTGLKESDTCPVAPPSRSWVTLAQLRARLKKYVRVTILPPLWHGRTIRVPNSNLEQAMQEHAQKTDVIEYSRHELDSERNNPLVSVADPD